MSRTDRRRWAIASAVTGLLACLLLAGCECGPAGLGEECACTSDCESGLYCTPEAEPPLDMGSPCDGDEVGTCHEYAGEGEICDIVDDVRCESGLTCNRGTDPARCIAGDAAEGDPCWTTDDCAADLLCNRALDPPACATPGDLDDPCTADEDCVSVLLCSGNLCRPPGTAGEACGEDADCATDLWCREEGCHTLGCGNGACAPLGSGATDEPCREDAQCASGTCHLVEGAGYQTLRCA